MVSFSGEISPALLLAQLCLLLFVARALGELTRALGLTVVVGELLTGIVLGPSLLGAVAPGLQSLLFPLNGGVALDTLGYLGLVMLLVLTGAEIDAGRLVERSVPVALTALVGIAVPFALGLAVGFVVPDAVLVDPNQRTVFALFLATALSISALPVIARILLDLGELAAPFGQLTVAAALLNDIVGWTLLSLVAVLARRDGVDPFGFALSLASLALFLVAALTVGRRAVSTAFRRLDADANTPEITVSAAMVLAFGLAAVTDALGYELVLGAFVAGLLVGDTDAYHGPARRSFEVLTVSVFAPIFFGIAGLRADLTRLFTPELALLTVGVVGVAVVGKIVGGAVGALLAGYDLSDAIDVGIALNARGVLELVAATVGLDLGILSVELYSVVVLVAVGTSVMTPPLLRRRRERRSAGR